MKRPLLIPLALVTAITLVAFAQESFQKTVEAISTDLSSESTTRIIGQVADGRSTIEELPKPEPIDFELIKSHTKRVQVTESPEMPGLPAPQGMINLTVELVKEPELADLPPLPLLEAEDPAVVARVEELSRAYPATELILVSASVYDHSMTHFRIQGNHPEAKEITGWSNIDFNHFSGFASYQVKGADGALRTYGLIMAIGDMGKADKSLNAPRLSNLAANGPSFILTEGDINNPQTKQLVEGLHSLYKVEGARLADAYRKRTEAYEKREQFLLANPPKPKDVTIRFWNREGSNPR